APRAGTMRARSLRPGPASSARQQLISLQHLGVWLERRCKQRLSEISSHPSALRLIRSATILLPAPSLPLQFPDRLRRSAFAQFPPARWERSLLRIRCRFPVRRACVCTRGGGEDRLHWLAFVRFPLVDDLGRAGILFGSRLGRTACAIKPGGNAR